MTDPLREPVIASALIVGGGIAGLSAAIGLSKLGVRVDIVELKGGAEGAGLGIQNRGIDALAALGVLDDVVAAGAAYQQAPLRFFDSAGGVIADANFPPRPDGKPSYIVVYRPRLFAVLADHAARAGAALRVGLTIEELQDGPDGVDVKFTDGSRETYGLVIGADGLRSSVRSHVFGDVVQPTPTGTVSLRTMAPIAGDQVHAGFYESGDAELVAIPMRDNQTYISVQHGEDVALDDEVARQLLHDKLSQFSAPFLQAVRASLTPDQFVLVRRYEWLLVESEWHHGRVVLIGDAAHATTAHLGSGGVMALEDAVVLVEELSRGDGLGATLTRFHERRFERCKLVVDTSVRLSALQANGGTPDEMSQARFPAMAAKRALLTQLAAPAIGLCP